LGTIGVHGLESEERTEYEAGLSPELTRYLSSDEIRNFDYNLAYAAVRSLEFYEMNILLLDTPSSGRDILQRLCIGYLRSYVINVDRLIREKSRYSDELAKLENNILIRTDRALFEKLLRLRSYLLLKYLRQKCMDFRHLELQTQELGVGLFVVHDRNESLRQLPPYMLGITRWIIEATDEQAEQYAAQKLKQSNLIRDLVQGTAPLQIEGYRDY
jgi:hypothetical protein